jgi:hypothetical protein
MYWQALAAVSLFGVPKTLGEPSVVKLGGQATSAALACPDNPAVIMPNAADTATVPSRAFLEVLILLTSVSTCEIAGCSVVLDDHATFVAPRA